MEGNFLFSLLLRFKEQVSPLIVFSLELFLKDCPSDCRFAICVLYEGIKFMQFKLTKHIFSKSIF